ncbi:MAG: sugar ABC transporter permease [Spirochaetales bacterium]|nr:sugar ABC transporter permease [Spirochaetales bacterium]
MRQSKWQGWNAWILPATILCFVISLTPWLIMIYNSFFSLSYTKIGSGGFIGLDNYRQVFTDTAFLTSIWVTIKFLAVSLPCELLLGLTLAVLVARHVFTQKFVVPILLIPMIISPTVVGLIWRLNLNPNFGIVGIFLKNIGFAKDGLLGSSQTALGTIIAIDIWQWTPFLFLLFLAGLLGQPKEPLEAAQVDGASVIQTFRRVTLPSLRPIFTVAFLLRFTDAYKIFDKIWMMTTGGPGMSTEALSIYGYRVNFKYWHIGYGSAVVMILFLVSYLITLVFFHLVIPPEKKIN